MSKDFSDEKILTVDFPKRRVHVGSIEMFPGTSEHGGIVSIVYKKPKQEHLDNMEEWFGWKWIDNPDYEEVK